MVAAKLPAYFKPYKILKDGEIAYKFRTKEDREHKMQTLLLQERYERYTIDFQITADDIDPNHKIT